MFVFSIASSRKISADEEVVYSLIFGGYILRPPHDVLSSAGNFRDDFVLLFINNLTNRSPEKAGKQKTRG